jgi:hypothetical protein
MTHGIGVTQNLSDGEPQRNRTDGEADAPRNRVTPE